MHRLGRHPQQPGRGGLIALGQFQGPEQELPPGLAEIILQGKAGLGFGQARQGIGGAERFGYLEVVRVQEVFGWSGGRSAPGRFPGPGRCPARHSPAAGTGPRASGAWGVSAGR